MDLPTDESAFAAFLEPLVNALGGLTNAQRALTRDHADGAAPDDRKALRRMLRGETRAQRETVFRVGHALRLKFPWCSGMLALYAAGHFDAYIAIAVSIARQADCRTALDLLIENAAMATIALPIDGFEVLEKLDGSGHNYTLGAICTRIQHDHAPLLARLKPLLPAMYAKDELLVAALDRNSARMACVLEGAVHSRCHDVFDAWQKSGRRTQFSEPKLALADQYGRSNLDYESRRQHVDEQLRMWRNIRREQNYGL